MNTKEKMHIVASCNTQFVSHLAALFVSILDNCTQKEYKFNFFVVDDSIEEESKELLRSTVNKYSAYHSLQFLELDKSYFTNVVISDRIPETAYYRIKIPELFRGTTIDKILYLDCDMIALTDITQLWQTDITQHLLAAVEDAGFHQRLEKMEIESLTNRYFNSGLMLINVKRWLNEGISDKVLDFIRNNPTKLCYHDQDALNAVLHDRWVSLHPKWNAQRYILAHETTPPNLVYERAYQEVRQAPHIIHYTGHAKPWNEESNVPARTLYKKYSRMTDFKESS